MALTQGLAVIANSIPGRDQEVGQPRLEAIPKIGKEFETNSRDDGRELNALSFGDEGVL